MTYTFFTTTSDSDEDEDPKYSSFVEFEDFEEEDPPEGFEGVQRGSSLEGGPSEEAELPRPWDPAESFFAYL
jgi:hypothetical protein